eukprot:TRINITY_DN11916_c0_g1_i12.p1 TRINITY_DN11916_c0_g1~~TRINITY_DN11916_c0_g1_i12.p1  ORF type:complete len:505 (-),score=109.62 TRINITY_DN11916_c0_g1_i12:929-2443(-)
MLFPDGDRNMLSEQRKMFQKPGSHTKNKVSKNGRLLSLEGLDSWEDTFSLSDTRPGSVCKLSYFPISIILVLIVIIVLLPLVNHKLAFSNVSDSQISPVDLRCDDPCEISLVESIPMGLVYNNSHTRKSTFTAWMELIELAEESIEQAGMYWTLRGRDIYDDPSDWQGEKVFQTLKKATKKRNLKLRIAQNQPRKGEPNHDTEDLQNTVGAQVRSLNFTHLMGSGILHTKLWLVDGKHFYVGSANFDWRSLTQVKEVGVLVKNCGCLAKDMAKIWEVYWELGRPGATVPDSWPKQLATTINAKSPLELENPSLSVWLSSSPPPFCPEGRDSDIQAILDVINGAKEFVRVAVMDYFPATIYNKKTTFWPVIDDALRRAAIERKVRVELLMSEWAHTRPSMFKYLKSLQDLNKIDSHVHIKVKLFKVPAFTPEQAKIPFGRVNHNKYLVTESVGFVGTSNWSADYFISTGGIGFVFQGHLREDLVAIFERDWNSSYATDLDQAITQ